MILYLNEGKNKKVYLREHQLYLLENSVDDGFRMSFGKKWDDDALDYKFDINDPKTIEFDPNAKGYADTNIFKNGTREFSVRKILLPKSGVESINLYSIRNMHINKALKHNKNLSGNLVNQENDSARQSLEYFKKRSAYYISRILSKMGVYPDIFTSPQSSSQFNIEMLNLLSKYYPNGDIVMMPQSFKKDPKNISIDYNKASEIGMTADDVAKLQNKVEHLKKDEDIRGYRYKIQDLRKKERELFDKYWKMKQDASQITKVGRRGRPTRELMLKKQDILNAAEEIWKQGVELDKEINLYNDLIKSNRRTGRDPTIDTNGNIKPMQIKTLDDNQRRAINGLFTFNNELYPSKKYTKNGEELSYSQATKFFGKVVVVFDDNISSGATLDMFCDSLKKIGVKMIIPITLGVIPLTSYNRSDRAELNKRQQF